jgi:LPXTG-site transpeptidase (sortase) family protein
VDRDGLNVPIHVDHPHRKELTMSKTTQQKKTWWRRLLGQLGAVMIVAALGCIALVFIGMGDTAGNIPAESEPESQPAPLQNIQGPTDKTLYLTIPKLGLEQIKVSDSLSEEALGESAIHVPQTGFPWQPGANTYIAGHRLGFVGTDSFLVFLRLNELESGDEIMLKDSTGKEYLYRITGGMVVAPEAVEVMNSVAGRSIVSLQTCTFPDFAERLIVQGELVA